MIPGTYSIGFSKSEDSTNLREFYEPLLPIIITVIDPSLKYNTSPTITIDNVEAETIGYPIEVPITLSIGILKIFIIIAPANLILLIITT